MSNAARVEQLVGRPKKAAKRLEIGPSELGHVELMVVAVVPGKLVERVALVVHVVKMVYEGKVAVERAGSQMPASEVALGPQRLARGGNVARPVVGVAVQWSESVAQRLVVMDGVKRYEQVPLVESDAMAVLKVLCMVVASVDTARGTAYGEAGPRSCKKWRQRGTAAEKRN